MRLILQFPRLLIFGSSVVLAYVLYQYGAFHWIEQHIQGADYPSMFVAGFLFSFGFTAPFSVAYFIEISGFVSPLPAAVLAGLGAAVSDVGIFQFANISLRDEILRLKATRVIQRMRAIIHHDGISDRMRRIGQWTMAVIVVASPLPDEIGMTLVAGLTSLKGLRLSLLCFLLNTLGILVILLAARSFASA